MGIDLVLQKIIDKVLDKKQENQAKFDDTRKFDSF